MRTLNQVNADIAETDRLIGHIKEARDIAAMPGGQRIIELLRKSVEAEAIALQQLDPYSERLSGEYAKHKYCKGEFVKLINYLERAQDMLAQIEQRKLTLIEELDTINKSVELREKKRM